MDRTSPAAPSVDAYIASHPPKVRALLNAMRKTIRTAAPDATETISYQMPAYVQHGALVYFAAFSKHIGFYPGAAGVAEFEDQLGDYVFAKGSIQFPFEKPLPLALVKKITAFRVQENMAKEAARALKKKKKSVKKKKTAGKA